MSKKPKRNLNLFFRSSDIVNKTKHTNDLKNIKANYGLKVDGFASTMYKGQYPTKLSNTSNKPIRSCYSSLNEYKKIRVILV